MVLAHNALSVFDNPAAGSMVQSHEIACEGASLYGDMSRHATGALLASFERTLNVAALYSVFFSGEIPRFESLGPDERSDGTPRGYFSNNHHYGVLSFSHRYAIPVYRISKIEQMPLPLEVAAGCNVKYYYQTMNPGNAFYAGANLNCDVGALLRVGIDYDFVEKRVQRECYFGVSIKDVLPTTITWFDSPYHYEEPVHRVEYYGICYNDMSGLLAAHWQISAAVRRSLQEDIDGRHAGDSLAVYLPSYHAGIQARFFETVALRAGYAAGAPTMGGGIAYRNVYLDYAFVLSQPRPSAARVSCGLRF